MKQIAPDVEIVDISSDEEPAGLAEDDYDWLSRLLEGGDDSKGNPKVEKPPESNHSSDDDDDKVVVVKEVNPKSLLTKKDCKSTSNSVSLDDDDDDDGDCVVLEDDPDKPKAVINNDDDSDGDDVVVLSQKGQIACKDYPHPRHHCAKFAFSSTPHERYCEQCHCYVCDSLAPCAYWGTTGISTIDHCHAIDKEELWKVKRRHFKLIKDGAIQVSKHTHISHSMIPSRSVPSGVILAHKSRLAAIPQNQISSPVAISQNQVSRPTAIFKNQIHRPTLISQNQIPRSTAISQHQLPTPTAMSKNQISRPTAISQNQIPRPTAISQNRIPRPTAIPQNRMPGPITISQNQIPRSVAISQNHIPRSVATSQNQMSRPTILRPCSSMTKPGMPNTLFQNKTHQPAHGMSKNGSQRHTGSHPSLGVRNHVIQKDSSVKRPGFVKPTMPPNQSAYGSNNSDRHHGLQYSRNLSHPMIPNPTSSSGWLGDCPNTNPSNLFQNSLPNIGGVVEPRFLGQPVPQPNNIPSLQLGNPDEVFVDPEYTAYMGLFETPNKSIQQPPPTEIFQLENMVPRNEPLPVNSQETEFENWLLENNSQPDGSELNISSPGIGSFDPDFSFV